MPEKFGGPKFWRRFIEAKPESTYGAYAGSTYPGSKPGGLDSFRILFNNLLQFLLGNESEDGAAVAGWDWRGALERAGPGLMAKSIATGDLQTLVGGPLFLLLTKYHNELGPVFKLAFGPRSFIVVADPSIMRYILRDGAMNYDKGILAEILAPILGNGLIPADPDVWRWRRRVITPAFHKQWLASTLSLFDECTMELVDDLKARHATAEPAPLPATVDAWTAWKADDAQPRALGAVDMEERFCSVSLDIIGLAVFNYDFGSTTRESPIIKAVYTCLQEAAHRSTFYFPYWNIPFMTDIVPRQREFKANMNLINETLNGLIAKAQKFEGTEDLEELQNRDYSKVNDPSLLRFLVDIRGADVTDSQLRDDLMTMLIAGHETTAAVLTWCLFCLAQDPALMTEVRAEIDEVLGPARQEARAPTYEEITKLELTRLCLAEALRLYPEPPILIRRCLEDVPLPRGAGESEVTLIKGMDVFISVWNLHRHPDCWEEPLKFDPKRFKRPFQNPGVKDWAGYDPTLLSPNALYPNEVASDFAFIPFGAGARKCIGDQYAMLEATSCLSMTLQRYEFELDKDAADVGMEMGATIHTAGGLPMKVRRRPAAASAR